MGTLALIGLGSNLGDRRAHLDRAVAALAETPGVVVRSVSRYRETAPAGGPPGQGAFLNAAARLDTGLDPLALLRRLQAIEDRAGRVRSARWGERPLDLDLLIFGCKRLDSPDLILPHPRMAVRRFVLAPLSEIAPEIVDTSTGLSVIQLLANLDRRPSYLALDGPPGASRDDLFRRIVEGLPSIGLAELDILPNEEIADPDDIPLGPEFPAKLRSKVRHLDRRLWEQTLGGARWLVTDFCLTTNTIWSEDFRPSHGYQDRDDIRVDYLAQLRDWLLPPTSILDLNSRPPGPQAISMVSKGRSGDVRLIPESDTVEEIAREALAACVASRDG